MNQAARRGDRVRHGRDGGNAPGAPVSRVVVAVALAWSAFQLYYASPLPFWLKEHFGFGTMNDTEARSVHLAFAVFLAWISFRARKRTPAARVPLHDWVLALAGAYTAAYLGLEGSALAGRAGAPTPFDLAVGVTGIALLLEATRRVLGPPMLVVAGACLVYTFAGQSMPDVIAHQGASLAKAMSHQWLSTEGVFGIALGVSTSFVFLFVLFGSLLERAGAGAYFIQLAFSLLGHLRGGPAKAAVVASGLTGLVSGSSIANVVTTGTFTIPLMKRVGFPGTKAGAIEAAASTNGQLMPPVMGAAAFLMVEYVGISYVEVIRHAILPALIGYAALVYIVHLEALKAGMRGLPRRHRRTVARSALVWLTTVLTLVFMATAVYQGIGGIKLLAPGSASWIVAALVCVAYVSLVAYGARQPPLVVDGPEVELAQVPETGPTLKAGLHYLLPVVVLMWFLVVERFSPGLSAFYATGFMIVIVVTQRPLAAFFRGDPALADAARAGLRELFEGLVAGARNMIGIGVATAAAGIIVGTVTLTGIGLVMAEFVELLSGGHLLAMLVLTALISLVLGMGLPTTANYIVVSTLMAPVIVTLGAAHGLVVPLIAVHLFVFYFGILADDTPPVGLAAIAAAAIARSDPVRTGVQGFAYDIRTAILPFMFIFNTELLLIGVDSVAGLLLVVSSATVAMLAFAAATQGYWLVRSRWWESVALLLIAFTLFRPGFWWDRFHPPLVAAAPAEIVEIAGALTPGAVLRVAAAGETVDGTFVVKTVALPMGAAGDGEERLERAGLALRTEHGKVLIDDVGFGSDAERLGLDFDWEIRYVQTLAERPPEQWMFLPALALLAVLARTQLRRRRAAPRAV